MTRSLVLVPTHRHCCVLPVPRSPSPIPDPSRNCFSRHRPRRHRREARGRGRHRVHRARTTIATDAARGSDDTIARIAQRGTSLIAHTGLVDRVGIGAPGELECHAPPPRPRKSLPRMGERRHRASNGRATPDPRRARERRELRGVGRISRRHWPRRTQPRLLHARHWRRRRARHRRRAVGRRERRCSRAFGHIVVDPNGPPCRCGQHGCVEQYASATAVATRYGRGSARDAFDAAARGEPDAIAVVDWACDGLAAGVANVIHIVQPDVVVLGGGMAAAGSVMLDRVRAGVARACAPTWLAHVRIECSALGDDAGWIGAALMGRTSGRNGAR